MQHFVIRSFVWSPVWAPTAMFRLFGVSPVHTISVVLVLLIALLLVICASRT